MPLKNICFAFFLLFIHSAYAQLCTGSLGDPVVKIDFGTGTSGHGTALGSSITSYTYTSADFPNDGSYTIEKTTNTPNTWWTTADHTGGGYMMIVNASTSITDYFYKKTVTGLCPDTTYEFAAWIMNLLKSQDNSTPDITFTIEKTDGTILETYDTGNIPLAGSALWKHFGFYFDTPAGIDTVVIRMRNNKVGAAPGNDIALDDITFRACGPEVTSSVDNATGTSFTVCQNQVPHYTLEGSVSSSVYTAPAYQWQLSTDGGTTYTDIAGATLTTLTVQPPQAAGTYIYRLSTAESTNIGSAACRVASNLITITVTAGPDTPVVTVAPTQCGVPTGSIAITSPTGYEYSIDGTNYQTAMTFNNLAENTYSVTARNTATGCISAAASAQVIVGGGITAAPTVTAAAPANCAAANGSLTVTDSAAAYSFDNGLTWVTGNTAQLPPGSYQVEVQNAQGCASAATTATVPQATGFPAVPTVTIVQPDCITTTGTITVTDVQAAYSFDNGATWGTSSSISNIAAGTYQVLTKNTLGCVSDPATVTITPYINNEPFPVASTDQSFCVYNNATLNDIVITGTNIQWYATPMGGSALATATVLQDNTTYYASQTVTLCESNRIPVLVHVLTIAAPAGSAAQQFCTTQTPTVALLEAQGDSLQWYGAAMGGTVLPGSTPLTNGTTYYATQTQSGCESQARLAVTVTIVSPTIRVSDVATILCDQLNDGNEVVDLTDYSSQVTTDAGSTFSYYTTAIAAANDTAAQQITDPANYAVHSGTTTVYVRVYSLDKCHQEARLDFTLVMYL